MGKHVGHAPRVGKDTVHPLGPWAPLVYNAALSEATRGHRRTSGEMGDGGEGQPSLCWDGLACFRVSRVQGCSGRVGQWSAEVLTMWMGDAGSRHFLDAQKV